MEVSKICQDVPFIICGLGVLLEAFCKPLGNCSSYLDILHLVLESPVQSSYLPFLALTETETS